MYTHTKEGHLPAIKWRTTRTGRDGRQRPVTLYQICWQFTWISESAYRARDKKWQAQFKRQAEAQ